jgi:nucleoside-diphosphate-sugar epimerase
MSDQHEQPVLVTGAAGFIGSHVVSALLARGQRVVGVDNFDPMYSPHTKRANLLAIEREIGSQREMFRFLEADVADPAAVKQMFDLFRPEGVIHLAARAGVRPSIADPVGYVRSNVLATSNMLEASGAAMKRGCSRVVVASSSSVYGNMPTAPFHEEMDVSRPISPYAATKRACELLGFTHWHLHQQPVAMLRFFTVYGPRQRPDLAISKFLAKVAAGDAIEMFGNGETSRDYTYIADIVSGVVASYDRIDQHGYRVWNLGSDRPVKLTDLIERIGETVGKPAKIVNKPMQQGDVEMTWADVTRARSELGYSPSTGLADGLRAQWEWSQRE